MKHEFDVSPVEPSIRTLGSEEGNAPPAARLNLATSRRKKLTLLALWSTTLGNAKPAGATAGAYRD
jgi:hypothetical protein